jgi:hypothetical protein
VSVVWVFVLAFPLLLGGPVGPIIVPATSQEHCERVRKLMASQLESHRSNATISLSCFQAKLEIEFGKKETALDLVY